MTDPLFTIIPLMIGIFGATISVILIIRESGLVKVEASLSLSASKIKALKNAKATDPNVTEAKEYRDKIISCRTWLGRYTFAAALLFGAWIFLTAFYVSFSGGCKQLSQPIQSCREQPDPNKPAADPKQVQANKGGFHKITEGVLFSDYTIGIVALLDLSLLIAAGFHLWRATANYRALYKMHTRLMRELGAAKAEDFKKTGGSDLEEKIPEEDAPEENDP